MDVTWRARLDEHLGLFTVEPLRLRAAALMESAVGLHAVQTLAAHLRLLPEREAHPDLFAALVTILDHAADPLLTAGLVVRYELLVLEALGFGLDLSQCALTGQGVDLAYVSPRSGRAASREAGRPWADRLLPLPGFLTEADADVAADPAAIEAGFRLTGHFLARHVWEPRGLTPPMTRDGLISGLSLGRPAAPDLPPEGLR